MFRSDFPCHQILLGEYRKTNEVSSNQEFEMSVNGLVRLLVVMPWTESISPNKKNNLARRQEH